jgi:hypothetical protein
MMEEEISIQHPALSIRVWGFSQRQSLQELARTAAAKCGVLSAKCRLSDQSVLPIGIAVFPIFAAAVTMHSAHPPSP